MAPKHSSSGGKAGKADGSGGGNPSKSGSGGGGDKPSKSGGGGGDDKSSKAPSGNGSKSSKGKGEGKKEASGSGSNTSKSSRLEMNATAPGDMDDTPPRTGRSEADLLSGFGDVFSSATFPSNPIATGAIPMPQSVTDEMATGTVRGAPPFVLGPGHSATIRKLAEFDSKFPAKTPESAAGDVVVNMPKGKGKARAIDDSDSVLDGINAPSNDKERDEWANKSKAEREDKEWEHKMMLQFPRDAKGLSLGSSGRGATRGGGTKVGRRGLRPGEEIHPKERPPGLGGHLPRELRDYIYEYLLDHTWVKYEPCDPRFESKQPHSKLYWKAGGRAPTYDFSMALTHVDKWTSIEAFRCFEKSNTFILVEYNMPQFEAFIHMFDVPIVTNNGLGPREKPNLTRSKLDDCEVHALTMKLVWVTPPLVEIEHLGRRVNDIRNDSKEGKVLMLAKDFPKLCSALKFLCQYSLPAGVWVGSGRQSSVQIQAKRRTDLLNLTLSVVRRQLELSTRAMILRSLQTVLGGGYALTLVGFCDTYDQDAQLTESMSMTMTPPLIWTRALMWDRLDGALEMKTSAEKLAKQGDLLRAVDQLHYLKAQTWDLQIAQEQANLLPCTLPDTERAVIVRRWQFLSFDLQMSIAELLMIASPTTHHALLWSFVDLNENFIASLPERLKLRKAHLEFVQNMKNLWEMHSLNDIAPEVKAFLDIESNSWMKDIGYITGDALILKSEIDNLVSNTALHSFVEKADLLQGDEKMSVASVLDRLSLFTSGFEIWDSQEFCDATKQSFQPWEDERREWNAELKQWVDTVHLASLTDADKTEILKLQMEKGLRESEF